MYDRPSVNATKALHLSGNFRESNERALTLGIRNNTVSRALNIVFQRTNKILS